ncbi:hypothetical protein [Paenibacillus radicis (ex Xue et al. 2023)]|uniref:Uncharacterized protein n=1 Tax=Paenibacillus radicis (ex Xue et al. 2023) TaxID=2972489 RepID=A0ABT1YBC5_9BACL|nr:hypothetical protein [Paenibacillus radicis (ex Xue et al. 2023)]MCR8630487.1 hypothetical protein [Paenibacillus radicis (ex Xue et al. 2023)]
MSKGRVWNKGKRNGGGGPPGGSKNKAVTSKENPLQQAGAVPTESHIVDMDNPINRVTRMNRENWVVRPARIIRKGSGNDEGNVKDES